MTNIKISDLSFQSSTSDLINNELKSIQGGYCREGAFIYPANSVVKLEDGKFYKCVDKPWYKGGDVFRLAKKSEISAKSQKG